MVKVREVYKQKLDAAGKRLENVSREEFDDIAHSVGLRRHKPKSN